MNAFESGDRKLIPAVLLYVFCGDEVLMIHRNQGRPGDIHEGKWNGLGGKLEANESPVKAAVRELKEEAEIELGPDDFTPLGTLLFPLFKPKKNQDWLVYVFKGEIKSKPYSTRTFDEGSLSWVDKNAVMDLNLWEGDRVFIPFVLEGKPFQGTFWYQEQRLMRSEIVKFET